MEITMYYVVSVECTGMSQPPAVPTEVCSHAEPNMKRTKFGQRWHHSIHRPIAASIHVAVQLYPLSDQAHHWLFHVLMFGFETKPSSETADAKISQSCFLFWHPHFSTESGKRCELVAWRSTRRCWKSNAIKRTRQEEPAKSGWLEYISALKSWMADSSICILMHLPEGATQASYCSPSPANKCKTHTCATHTLCRRLYTKGGKKINKRTSWHKGSWKERMTQTNDF